MPKRHKQVHRNNAYNIAYYMLQKTGFAIYKFLAVIRTHNPPFQMRSRWPLYHAPQGNLWYRLFRSVEGYEFQGFVPPCYDPTYCEADPPVPFYGNALYKNPPLGTLRYNDGETVTYTCQNSSKWMESRSKSPNYVVHNLNRLTMYFAVFTIYYWLS